MQPICTVLSEDKAWACRDKTAVVGAPLQEETVFWSQVKGTQKNQCGEMSAVQTEASGQKQSRVTDTGSVCCEPFSTFSTRPDLCCYTFSGCRSCRFVPIFNSSSQHSIDTPACFYLTTTELPHLQWAASSCLPHSTTHRLPLEGEPQALLAEKPQIVLCLKVKLIYISAVLHIKACMAPWGRCEPSCVSFLIYWFTVKLWTKRTTAQRAQRAHHSCCHAT